jgi:nucleoside-diphosphate-sugar epimerase
VRILFIGGTGNISSACVDRALSLGYEVTLLTRGLREIPQRQGLSSIAGDRNDLATLRQVAESARWDVVANFIAFTPDQVALDIEAFGGRVGQYLFISSASAYQKPPGHYVITESTPLRNPFWQYSRDKIACEDALVRAYRESGFPVTIVRPSYTYGPTWIPCAVGGHGYTVVGRMRQGNPVISHGDGQSLWVMTHNSDFAVGFVGLFGVAAAIGEAFHITSDEVLTWDDIYRAIASTAGCEAELVHIPSDLIAAAYPDWGAGLLGDKAHSVVFDNSKIKRLVPEFGARVRFAEGMRRSVGWHDEDPTRQMIDEQISARMDHLIELYRHAWP